MNSRRRIRQELPPALAKDRLVAVVRTSRTELLEPVVETLLESGVSAVELTFTIPDLESILGPLIDRFESRGAVGVGSVTSKSQLDSAAAAGAHFAVTPNSDPSIVERAISLSIPIIPGGLTPTELVSSWVRGVAAVKLFPANAFGVGYLRDLAGPFPDLRVVPSGGIGIQDVPVWLSAGAHLVGLGGPLLQDVFETGDLESLSRRAAQASELASSVQPVIRQQRGPE